MATRVYESRVVSASVDVVWDKIRSLDFSKWLDTVSKVDIQGGAGEVGSLRKVEFKDGTLQTLKVLELSDLNHTITYEIIESQPAISVMSAVHTIALKRISHDNTTFIEWYSDFSNDATQEVLQDSKFKKQEGFASLIKAVDLGK
jgi:hypothetical protein